MYNHPETSSPVESRLLQGASGPASPAAPGLDPLCESCRMVPGAILISLGSKFHDQFLVCVDCAPDIEIPEWVRA